MSTLFYRTTHDCTSPRRYLSTQHTRVVVLPVVWPLPPPPDPVLGNLYFTPPHTVFPRCYRPSVRVLMRSIRSTSHFFHFHRIKSLISFSRIPVVCSRVSNNFQIAVSASRRTCVLNAAV